MISDRPAGTGVIIVTLLLAALLEVIPLPASIDWVRPEWMLLVLVYWVLSLPHRIGVLWGSITTCWWAPRWGSGGWPRRWAPS